jgi:hypothetical protein
VLARSGAVAEAKRLQSELIDQWRRTGRGAHSVAYIAAGFDDYDQVFEWLDRAEDLAGASAIMYPLFKGVHADPRFDRFRQRIGLQKP